MIRSYLNLIVMLLFSWSVYGSCQQDTLLPMIAGGIVVLSLLARLQSAEKQFMVFEQIPLSMVIIVSFLAGIFWRNFVPIPEESISPYPGYTAALQSASIFAAILFWLRPLSKKNLYRLFFCGWLTVGLSMNVPFNSEQLMIFSAFCFIALAIVIFNTMRRPGEKRYNFLYVRDYIFFSTLLMMFTIILFFGISTTVVAFERAFMQTMSELIMPRQYTNFLRISPQLNLITPGTSAFDRRPVLEINVPYSKEVYLKLQVFDRYNNGTWDEPRYISKQFMPTKLISGQLVGRILMFTPFQNIIPSPPGITAVKTKIPYELSRDQVLYTQDQQHTRIFEFSQSRQFERIPVELSDEDYQKYITIPPGIAPQLQRIAYSVTNGEGDEKVKIQKLLQYFHQNFQYSLDTVFSADDNGLIRMLDEKRPAYCTYFASAMVLLLRVEGIPARVGAGFLTTELVNRANNTYLVRVNNAHAWAEVLVAEIDPVTGQSVFSWQIADATPPTFSVELKKNNAFNLEKIFEEIWLATLRMNARVENMDKDKLKLSMVLFLFGMIVYINRKKIIVTIQQWLRGEKSTPKPRYQTSDFLRIIYGYYEVYLKEEFGEVRHLSDTDRDVIGRLKKRFVMETSLVSCLEDFIEEFHAVRFGTKSPHDLINLLDEIKKFTKNEKKA